MFAAPHIGPMTRAEIFAHENGVERHHCAVRKTEHQREAVKAREIAGE
jgi:hypothetical protein